MSICPTCHSPRCGNHAACARRGTHDEKQAVLDKFISDAAEGTVSALRRYCGMERNLMPGDIPLLAWLIAIEVEKRLRADLPAEARAQL